MITFVQGNKSHVVNVKTLHNVVFDRIYAPVNMDIIGEQLALIVDLRVSENVIKKAFSGTVKKQINRCEKNNSPIVSFVDCPTDEDLQEYNEAFVSFANNKDSDIMRSVVGNVEEIGKTLTKSGVFVISSCCSKEHPELKIFHSHMVDKSANSVRGVNYFSSYRGIDKELQDLVGNMNRYLHYQDFLYFKNRGFDYYDLGGISFSSNIAITNFKLGFSNKVIKYYYASSHNGCPPPPPALSQPKIALVWDESSYAQALAVVNLLASHYIFCLCQKEELSRKVQRKFDLVWDFTEKVNKAKSGDIYGFDPREFYYIDDRMGNEVLIGYQSECESFKTAVERNTYFNSIDVFVSNDKQRLVEALACGCLVITDMHKKYTEDGMGYLIENIEDKTAVNEYCTKYFRKIRNQAFSIAVTAVDKYSYFRLTDAYLQFLRKNVRKHRGISIADVFSIRNKRKNGKKYKEVTVLGIKIKI